MLQSFLSFTLHTSPAVIVLGLATAAAMFGVVVHDRTSRHSKRRTRAHVRVVTAPARDESHEPARAAAVN